MTSLDCATLTRRLLLPLAAALVCAGCSSSSVGTGTPGSASGGTASDGTTAAGTTSPTAPSNPRTPPTTGPVTLPAGAKVFFVTSAEYDGDLRAATGAAAPVEGGAAADVLCQAAADGAQLKGTFTAFVNDSAGTAQSRITGNGPWYTLGGKKVFNNKAGLLSTPLELLTVDEQGKFVTGWIWIGSNTGTCQNWTSGTLSTGLAYSGGATSVGSMRSTDSLTCNNQGHLYCLEQ
jgi:hypothetical protein